MKSEATTGATTAARQLYARLPRVSRHLQAISSCVSGVGGRSTIRNKKAETSRHPNILLLTFPSLLLAAAPAAAGHYARSNTRAFTYLERAIEVHNEARALYNALSSLSPVCPEFVEPRGLRPADFPFSRERACVYRCCTVCVTIRTGVRVDYRAGLRVCWESLRFFPAV